MQNMMFFVGMWMIILPKMQWNVLKDRLWVSIYSYILGIYTLTITIILRFSISKISNKFFILCFSLSLILNIIFMKNKIKTENSLLSKIMMCIACLCIVLSLLIVYLDVKEISSAISILTSTMIILSIPYDNVKRRNRDKRPDRN